MMAAIGFLLGAVAGFFTTLFLLRFLMQATRTSFSGQLGDFVVRLTNWAVKPLRRLIPGIAGIDWASLVAAFALQLALAAVLVAISGVLASSADPANLALLIVGIALRAVLRLVVYIAIGALILQAVLSWINPYSPLAGPANQITRPLLDPIRRFIPLISGIDLSPLVAILLLQAVLMFL
jgi:YggT family protein